MPTADEADPTAPTGNLPSSGAASPKKAATKTAARQPVGASHGRPAAVMAPVPVAAATNTVDVVFGVAAALIALGVAGYLFYIGATDIGI